MVQNRNYLFCTGMLFLCSTLSAQNFRTKALLTPVTKTGFYSIQVTPQLSSYLAVDFRDLRIEDEQRKQVPYIIKNPIAGFFQNKFEQLKILSYQLTDSGKSVLIIENPTRAPLTDIALSIRNAAVNRIADISGSDSLNTWFALAQRVTLERKFSNDSDTYEQNLRFPLTTYRYINVTIYNSNNPPLNIMQAGRYYPGEYKSVNSYIINPAPGFTSVDSNNNVTYIKVNSHGAYHTNGINLIVKGPVFFNRDVEVVLEKGSIYSFKISSGSLFKLETPVFNDSSWVIKIYNGDNPPLLVKAISTQQEKKEIVAYFEKGKQYRLLMSADNAVKPTYDLQNFADSIPAELPNLSFAAIEQNKQAIVKRNTIFTKNVLWPVLILVSGILVFFTWRLARDLQNKSKDK